MPGRFELEQPIPFLSEVCPELYAWHKMTAGWTQRGHPEMEKVWEEPDVSITAKMALTIS